MAPTPAAVALCLLGGASAIVLRSGKQITSPALPALPDDIRALGAKLLSQEGLSEVLANTQCLTNGQMNYNVTMSMCGYSKDDSFIDTWFEHGQSDYERLRRPGLDPNGVFVDVGAYIGDTTLIMHKLYPQAKIYSFEVNPRSYFFLRWNLRLNGVPEIPCDGSPAGPGVCAQSEPTGFGDGKPIKIRTISDAAQEGGASMMNRKMAEGRVFKDIEVRTMSPQQLFQQAKIDKISFFKMDCQGCEWTAEPLMEKKGIFSRIEHFFPEIHCVKDELPGLTHAALVERQRIHAVLKEKSGNFYDDNCAGDAQDKGTGWGAFNLDAEVERTKPGK